MNKPMIIAALLMLLTITTEAATSRKLTAQRTQVIDSTSRRLTHEQTSQRALKGDEEESCKCDCCKRKGCQVGCGCECQGPCVCPRCKDQNPVSHLTPSNL